MVHSYQSFLRQEWLFRHGFLPPASGIDEFRIPYVCPASVRERFKCESDYFRIRLHTQPSASSLWQLLRCPRVCGLAKMSPGLLSAAESSGWLDDPESVTAHPLLDTFASHELTQLNVILPGISSQNMLTTAMEEHLDRLRTSRVQFSPEWRDFSEVVERTVLEDIAGLRSTVELLTAMKERMLQLASHENKGRKDTKKPRKEKSEP